MVTRARVEWIPSLQDEEVHLLHPHGIFARREVGDGKVTGVVGQRRNFRLSQTFKFYLNPGNGQSVFVRHRRAG